MFHVIKVFTEYSSAPVQDEYVGRDMHSSVVQYYSMSKSLFFPFYTDYESQQCLVVQILFQK
jgi:hypothetical protein